MKKWRRLFIIVVLLSLFAAFNRSSDAGTDLTTEQPFKSRTEVRQQGAVTIRAAVLTDWRGSTSASTASVVAQSPMSDVIPPKRTAAGFVFTHREDGLKLFEVGFETDRQTLRFRFVLPVGGSSYAIEKVDFAPPAGGASRR